MIVAKQKGSRAESRRIVAIAGEDERGFIYRHNERCATCGQHVGRYAYCAKHESWDDGVAAWKRKPAEPKCPTCGEHHPFSYAPCPASVSAYPYSLAAHPHH